MLVGADSTYGFVIRYVRFNEGRRLVETSLLE